ncbi:MAG: alkaline phosphatase family protein [Thermoleophilia bacterium]|nr:alkaline phosphatase family protein [Thermoleophilia bacterium]
MIVDGLPVDLLERELPRLPFIRERLPHAATAVSCFPSTTGPAYFPFLAGASPGRANVPGIRWFDRTVPSRSRFPHRGLRSYVGPDAARMRHDTAVRTILADHAWPASSPVNKDSPKRQERSRDVLWALAHVFHTWSHADRRTAWKLGRGLRKGRPIVFAVFPSVDELGHVYGVEHERVAAALRRIDAHLARKLDGFAGQLVLSADHGLTTTREHLDLRALVEERAGPTLAFPLIALRDPRAVVCESGNGMANVYLRGASGWRERPSAERARELARALAALEGVDSVAIRGEQPDTAELHTRDGRGEVGFAGGRLWQRGPVFGSSFADASPESALASSLGDERPDAAFALTSLLASERAGDLLVSATPGFDLRARREWPEHHASHGALHRAHTLVPVRSSALLPDPPLRTLDVFAHVLELAGVPLERFPDSDAYLLRERRWRPAVARAVRA